MNAKAFILFFNVKLNNYTYENFFEPGNSISIQHSLRRTLVHLVRYAAKAEETTAVQECDATNAEKNY